MTLSVGGMANAGCDVFEIVTITGHSDIKEVQTYVAIEDKKKAAQNVIAKTFRAA